jgi:glutamate-1-semialdehyde 2,1-aminomutase
MTVDVMEEWAAANPASRRLHERAVQVLPGGLTHASRRADPFPVAVARAQGSHKTDLDGHDLIDYVMGHGALLLGHSHPAVVEAVRAVVGRYQHPGACQELEVEWAERVCRLVPSAQRVRFTSSGTEATMLALQVARAFTGRPRVIRFQSHFHGWHDAAKAGDGVGVPPTVDAAVAVLPPDPQAVAAELAAGDVAAVVLEPTGASFGALPLDHGFLASLRELSATAGTLLIFDEVVSGFRWAPGGVQQLAGVTPDLTTLAKVLAGGMPGGALAGRAEVMEVLDSGEDGRRVHHPGTHNAHPVSAAAGVATLDLVGDGTAQSRADELAAWLRERLNAAFERCGAEGFAYGESSVFRVVLGRRRPVGPPTEWWRDPAAAALRNLPRELLGPLQAGMLLHGVHLFQGRGLVSSVHTEEDVERTVHAFELTLRRLQREGVLA